MLGTHPTLGCSFSSKPPPWQLPNCNVFSFRGGIRCGILLGTLPSYHTTIKLEYKTRLDLASSSSDWKLASL
ncbi:UNVERIFIED_CONTAM: hypothetical protein Sradi_4386900 [Sesamum radiatum]|uniref:Uncharacterized protein n=1 Tax=Sesamum radiatum TaxID=300843 RepID=A0AAW2NQU2_SESRA